MAEPNIKRIFYMQSADLSQKFWSLFYLSTKHENHQNTSMCFKYWKKSVLLLFYHLLFDKKNITGLEWNVTSESFKQFAGKYFKILSVIKCNVLEGSELGDG